MQPLGWVNRWLNKSSLQALEKAYTGAKAIRAIEEQHFSGGKITPNVEGGKSVYDYFQTILERELLNIRFNLTQFRLGNFVNSAKPKAETSVEEREILQTLGYIESVISKYRMDDVEEIIKNNNLNPVATNSPSEASPPRSEINQGVFDLNQKLTPEYEQQVIQKLRVLRQEKKIAIRFMILLVIIPLLVQISTKNLFYSPLINWRFVDSAELGQVKINEELAEKFLEEFSRVKEGLEIKSLLGIEKDLSEEKTREVLREKALELGTEAAYKSLEGWKNLLADLTSLLTFTAFIYFFRRQVYIVRQFVSRYFLALNDVTKVFIFILLTDMFVGFHSAEGWEVIIESTFGHFGLPESRNFVFLFIATVPVIMDSVFKLLIFNYFTRKSPTAVAILEKMQQ